MKSEILSRLFFDRPDVDRAEENRTLLESIAEVRSRMAAAYSAFNNARDSMLIDASIYEINSLQAKYAYYLNRAKFEKIENSCF